MKRIKKESKKGQIFLARYKSATAESVKQFYGRPSSRKIEIELGLRHIMQGEKGKGFKIISGNGFYFTAAWLTSGGLRVKTAWDSYIII